MPVKKRLPKGRARRITPEIVVLFKAALPMARKHLAAIRGGVDLSDAEHEEMIEAVNVFNREMGIQPWAVSPLDDDLDGPMPEYEKSAAAIRVASWEIAKELRDELFRASGIKRST